ncbi:hypothetical protein PAMP_014447 [Pampus punctatissimus]
MACDGSGSGHFDECVLTAQAERKGRSLWIQMSPPLDFAPDGDQQCVTDMRLEPAVALYCVASNWPWLSSAWSNE